MDSKPYTPGLGYFHLRFRGFLKSLITGCLKHIRLFQQPASSSGRTAFFWSISSLIILAWLVLWIWGQSPYGRYLEHGQLGAIGHDGATPLLLSATLYIAGWTLMTIAMMLPTTLPLLEIFRRLTRQRPEQLQLITLVILGYLAVWVCFGGAAHLADWLIHQLVERSGWLEQNVWVIGAGTLLLAGGFQFSRLKYRCLDKCRAPLSFVMEHWRGRHDYRNALLLGTHHGVFCVGCCWALMLLMFGVGVGNLGWMLGLGAVMAVEKNMPWGRKLSAPLGLALLGCGAILTLTHF
jgi:predicted metal-binding membrane protein